MVMDMLLTRLITTTSIERKRKHLLTAAESDLLEKTQLGWLISSAAAPLLVVSKVLILVSIFLFYSNQEVRSEKSLIRCEEWTDPN